MKKKRMKQAYTSPPKKREGKKIAKGHGMFGLFGAQTPKKPEMDNFTPTRAKTASTSAARMKRLDKRLI